MTGTGFQPFTEAARGRDRHGVRTLISFFFTGNIPNTSKNTRGIICDRVRIFEKIFLHLSNLKFD